MQRDPRSCEGLSRYERPSAFPRYTGLRFPVRTSNRRPQSEVWHVSVYSASAVVDSGCTFVILSQREFPCSGWLCWGIVINAVWHYSTCSSLSRTIAVYSDVSMCRLGSLVWGHLVQMTFRGDWLRRSRYKNADVFALRYMAVDPGIQPLQGR